MKTEDSQENFFGKINLLENEKTIKKKKEESEKWSDRMTLLELDSTRLI